MGFCNCSMFCCALLYVHSSFAIFLMGKSEMVSLLSLSSCCLVIVFRLFFVFSLWYFLIILTFFFFFFFGGGGVSFMRTLHIWISLEPSSLNQYLTRWIKCLFYTIYASIGGRIWRVCTFAWSSLSICHSSKTSCGSSNVDWMPFCAGTEGSGESAHLHRLTLAFVTVQNIMCYLKWRLVGYSRQANPISEGSGVSAYLHRLAWACITVSKYHVLAQMATCVPFMWTANDVVSNHGISVQPLVRCIDA